MADLDLVLAATRRHWDLDVPLPVPVGDWLACPVCRSAGPRIRWWRYHLRGKSETTPYRCDVSFKCVECGAVWMHGVVVPVEHWDRRPFPHRDRQTIAWRHGRELIER